MSSLQQGLTTDSYTSYAEAFYAMWDAWDDIDTIFTACNSTLMQGNSFLTSTISDLSAVDIVSEVSNIATDTFRIMWNFNDITSHMNLLQGAWTNSASDGGCSFGFYLGQLMYFITEGSWTSYNANSCTNFRMISS